MTAAYVNKRKERKSCIMMVPKLALSMIICTSALFGQSLAIKKMIHREKLHSTTTTIAPSSMDNYHDEEMLITEMPTTRCPFGEHPHGDIAGKGDNTIMNGEQVNEQQLQDMHSMRWRLIPSPVRLEDEFPPLMNNANLGSEEEVKQQDPVDPNTEDRRDFGYELVNHIFGPHSPESETSGQQDSSNAHRAMNDLNDNWWAWRNSISFFPSGQAHLKRYWKTAPREKQVPSGRPHYRNDLGGLRVEVQPSLGAVNPSKRPTANEIDTGLMKLNKGQMIDGGQLEVQVSPRLSHLQIIDSVKSENMNEVDQQDLLHFREPIMHNDEHSTNLGAQQTLSTKMLVGPDPDQSQATSPTTSPAVTSTLEPSSNGQRVRESLLKAADIARHLTQPDSGTRPETRTSSSSIATKKPLIDSSIRGADFDSESGTKPSSSLDLGDNERQYWPSPDQSNSFDFPASPSANISASSFDRNWQFENNNSLTSSRRLEPVYLGFGQVHKNNPIGGTGRIQARLSCQFGSTEYSNTNMSISDVQWAKFSGDYNPHEDGPSFECISRHNCELIEVKTDAITTVHPRPAVQNYLNTMAPSYSITLHEVGDKHLGFYRCSAIRRMGDQEELVYRIVPL